MNREEPRAAKLLGEPALSSFVERIVRRLQRGDSELRRISLANPSREERIALGKLLGRNFLKSRRISVHLSDLDRIFRDAGVTGGVIQAVEAVRGPISNLAAERAGVESAWSALFAEMEEPLREWMDEPESRRLIRRLSGNNIDWARSLLATALRVTKQFPLPGIPLAELAARETGNSHALDAGAPLGTILCGVAARMWKLKAVRDPQSRRDAWASAGVLLDELSAPVLTFRLRADENSFAGRALCRHADSGEPYRLTVRQLLRDCPSFSPQSTGIRVYVCENPTVVSAAVQRLGTASAPILCTEGQVKTAARLLIRKLLEQGVTVFYHGDFDWGGLHIGNVVIGELGAAPWRFSADDYRRSNGTTRLPARAAEALWDPELSAAMRERGVAVYEEQLLDCLLEDLANRS